MQNIFPICRFFAYFMAKYMQTNIKGFPFYDYSYILDINKQDKILCDLTPLKDGLKESYNWYINNKDKVRIKPLLEYINNNLKKE